MRFFSMRKAARDGARTFIPITHLHCGTKKELIPFAKAYSGLNQTEIDELDAWIRRHTKEKFGPVRSVESAHVFEIGFEGIAPSSRHKSGIAVRFPRILRWRKDKNPKTPTLLKQLKNF